MVVSPETVASTELVAIDYSSIDFSDWTKVLKAVARPTAPVAPTHPLPPSSITDEQRAALVLLPSVFGKVRPTEARTLTPTEIADLWAERKNVREIKDALDNSEEALKIILFGHFDAKVKARPASDPNSAANALVSKEGWFCTKESEPIPGEGKVTFQRYLSTKAPRFDPNALKAIAADPNDDRLSEDDWRACTSLPNPMWDDTDVLKRLTKVQLLGILAEITDGMRHWDNEAALKHLQNNPQLLAVVAEATVEVPPTPCFTAK